MTFRNTAKHSETLQNSFLESERTIKLSRQVCQSTHFPPKKYSPIPRYTHFERGIKEGASCRAPSQQSLSAPQICARCDRKPDVGNRWDDVTFAKCRVHAHSGLSPVLATEILRFLEEKKNHFVISSLSWFVVPKLFFPLRVKFLKNVQLLEHQNNIVASL